MKNIFHFLINASIWVAISVASLAGVTYHNLELELNNKLLCFSFFGTIFAYNFIKYFEKEQLSVFEGKVTGLKRIIAQYKKLQFFEKLTFQVSIISAVICATLLFALKLKTQLLLVVPLVLTFSYAVSLGYTTLRNISGIKIYVVALVWAFVTVLLPIIESEAVIIADIYLLFIQRLVFVVVLILPFEIRDLSIDDKQLGTLPQKIGVQKTKFYGFFLLMIFFFLEFFKDELLGSNLVVIPLVFMITLLFLTLTKENQPKYYASFFVEGIPVLWFVLLLLL